MSKTLAHGISLIFGPVVLLSFMPFFIVLRSKMSLPLAFWWTGYTIALLGIFVLFLLIARHKHIFTDLDVSERTQRPLLFRICLLFVSIYALGVLLFHGPFVLLVVSLGILVGILIASVINRELKASIHSATVAGIVFSLVFVYSGFYALLLLGIPLMVWARVKIHRHTVAEGIVGAVLGTLLSFSIYTVLRFFGHHA